MFDIKVAGFVGLCSCFFGREEREQESEQERMDLLSYSVERLLDVAAALVLRAGLKLVDRYFNVSAAAGTGGVAAEVEVPIVYGTSSRAGSGTGSSIVGGGGSRRSPSGGQPNGCVGDMLGGGDVVLDFTEAE